MEENKDKDFDLIEKFTRIEWLLHRYHLHNHIQFGPMGDPRKGQGRVLAILKMKPEISQKDLSYLLDMRPQSLGELLSKLEKNGYITRTASESDRRVMNIKLTKEGSEATENDFSFDKMFECLSVEEQKTLSNYLTRIIETLEAQLGDEQPEADFDPRMRGGNPFRDQFGRHPGWPGDGFHGGEFHSYNHPENEDNVDHHHMDQVRHGRMPFVNRPRMGHRPNNPSANSQAETNQE